MAKKKKKKFKKKHLKAALPQSSFAKTTTDKPDAPTNVLEHEEVKDEKVEEEQNEYSYIRKDVRNVLIILAIMLALIVTAYLIDQNTTIFAQFSDWLFKVTNIQIN